MKKFIKIMTGFMNRMAQDHVSAFAAQAAFFILMSFVPFLMLLLPLVTYVSITKDMVVEILLQIMPDAGDFRSFLFSIIQEVYDKSTAIVPISAVFGNSIQKLLTKYIPTLAKVTAYVIGMRTAVSLVVLALIFLMIYKFLPNRKTSFRSQIPGAVVSAVAWSLFSLGFSVYLDYYDGFSNMYGSLTTIILVLLWLYFCMYIVLIGAEINAYFEERLRRLHQMASELIRSEYQGLLKGIRENDTERSLCGRHRSCKFPADRRRKENDRKGNDRKEGIVEVTENERNSNRGKYQRGYEVGIKRK